MTESDLPGETRLSISLDFGGKSIYEQLGDRPRAMMIGLGARLVCFNVCYRKRLLLLIDRHKQRARSIEETTRANSVVTFATKDLWVLIE